MKRPFVIAAYAVVAEIVLTAVLLLAPFFVLLAVPWLAGIAVSRRHERAGAVIIALAGLLVVALAVPNFLATATWKDRAFDVVAGTTALVAIVLAGNRVSGFAGR